MGNIKKIKMSRRRSVSVDPKDKKGFKKLFSRRGSMSALPSLKSNYNIEKTEECNKRISLSELPIHLVNTKIEKTKTLKKINETIEMLSQVDDSDCNQSLYEWQKIYTNNRDDEDTVLTSLYYFFFCCF